MAIKGSTKIELTNVHTGQKEVVEHYKSSKFLKRMELLVWQ